MRLCCLFLFSILQTVLVYGQAIDGKQVSGLGPLSTNATPNYMSSTNNLAEVSAAHGQVASQANLGLSIGTNVEAWSSALDAWNLTGSMVGPSTFDAGVSDINEVTIKGSGFSTNQPLTLMAPSTSKGFALTPNGFTFSTGVFYMDGSYRMGSGAGGRDVGFARLSPALMGISDGTGSNANGGLQVVSLVDTGIATGMVKNTSGTFQKAVLNTDYLAPPQINLSITHSFVTSTAATGFQVDPTGIAFVSYSVTISTTATIGGASSGLVYLEICPINSTNPSLWSIVAQTGNSQTITLAVALQSIQTTTSQVSAFVPAGYYARLRSSNVSGSPTFTYNSGAETLF